MLLRRACLASAVLALCAATALASPPEHVHHDGPHDPTHDHDRPDAYAPIGVMGDHVHHKGGLMFSYRFAKMQMEGNLEGTRKRTTDDVLFRSDNPPGPPGPGFPVAPFYMGMEMHMFGVMYGVLEDLTLTAMLPLLRLDMDHQTRDGAKFTTRSNGIGDFKLGGLYRFFERGGHSIHSNLTLSFPTGSINERDNLPIALDGARLPYPMQLGSGSLAVIPGLTYNGQTPNWSWGAQATGSIQTYENDNDYRVGNSYNLTAWGARKWTSWLSTAFRADWRQWFNYSGADPQLTQPVAPASNPMIPTTRIVPTADTDKRGGRRLDLGLSFNLYAPRAWPKGLRFAAEALVPVYQSLDGPQLRARWRVIAGIQYSLPVKFP